MPFDYYQMFYWILLNKVIKYVHNVFAKILINLFERKKQHPIYHTTLFLLLKPNINL
jgi:hypothetical protein